VSLSPETSHALAVLLGGYALGEFVFQSSRYPRRSTKGTRVLLTLRHALVHAGLVWVLLGIRNAWVPPASVFLVHLVTRGLADRQQNESARNFAFRQLAHGLVLLGLAFWLSRTIPSGLNGSAWMGTPWDLRTAEYYRAIGLLAGFIATVEGGAQLIARFVRPYLDELENALSTGPSTTLRPIRGLTNAGRVIGKLERSLVFLLVLVGQPGGIGFLIAAKSIFRFGELKETANRMESEYIIIGTLASFGYAVAAAYATSKLVGAIP